MALYQFLDYFRNGKITWLKRAALILFIFFIAAHLLSFLILSPIIPYDFGKLIGITPKG